MTFRSLIRFDCKAAFSFGPDLSEGSKKRPDRPACRDNRPDRRDPGSSIAH
jgi:hypothetical protein